MDSNGSNNNKDRPDDKGVAGSTSVEEEVSRKRPFKRLAQDVSSNTYSRGNNNIMGLELNRDQMNENIPEGLETMVRRMISKATQDMQNRMDTIQNENIELKDKCNELEIKVKDLTLKNEYNEWSYMAEDIPASHWIERGFSEEYAQQMRSFISMIKDCTHQLRRGASLEIKLISSGDDMLHDDILLPHWKEFVDALQQYQKFEYREAYGFQRFAIINVQLHQEVINMLAPALQTVKLKNLVLGRNIGSEVVSFMAEIIHHNPYIQSIGLSNQIDNVDYMQRLCNAIKKSASNYVETLELYSVLDGNNSEMMRIALDASLHLAKLGLPDNGIGFAGASVIANFLASDPPLKEMCLDDNVLNNDDAELLANSLQSNTHLKRLHLHNNNITAVGRRVLLESVFNVSNLNACAASNDKCEVHGLNPDISKINRYAHPSDNRAMKIFTMLSAIDDEFFNMSCLGEYHTN